MIGSRCFWPILTCTVSAVALLAAGGANAQDAGQNAPTEQVVVTGTRIVTNGNNLPTPVTVVSSTQLVATTPSSIPDALNKLPSFDTTSTPNNAATGANGRGYNAPGNFLNLRDLGAIRTLILQDGNRVPGTFYDTTVDTDMLPQMLIQRVEVVTGGASAVYGSDAVSGVVNFITDTKFEGLKGVLQGGISTYGDRKSVRAGIAGGEDIGDRGHLEWSLEYTNTDAIPDDAARPYGLWGTSIVGSGTAASPYKLVYNIRESNTAPGGLVTSGPFAGQQFLNNGQLAPFNPGTPTPTTNFSIGGDGGIQHNEYLLPSNSKGQGFARFDYDITNDLHGFVEARYALARSYEANQGFTNTAGSYPLTFYSGNPFLPASAQEQLTAAGVNSFSMNRFDNDLARRLGITNQTSAVAVTAGVNGRLFGDFTWDAHYTHGYTRTMLTTHNNVNAARLYAAADAVVDPSTGKTVCEVSISAPGAFPGCVPIDLFGQGNESQAALNYVEGDTYWVAHNTLDDFAFNTTGTAFNDWAGPVKVAVGLEYRLAGLDVDTSVPDDTFDSQYLRLGPDANSLPASATNPNGYPSGNLAWYKEVQAGAHGNEGVYEGDIEINAPIIKDVPLFELVTLDGAYRYTGYTTGGNQVDHSDFSANTWKVGLEWQVTDDIRIRATRSRDIRAPTLWDLYQQQVISSSGISDPLTGVAGPANTVMGGNPDLKPEVAANTTAGVVFTPSWLPNFSASVDYYHVEIDNAIGQVNGLDQTIQNLCLNSPGGSSPYCALVERPISYNSTDPKNFPTLIYSLNQNIAQIYAEGIDIEANYGTDLSEISDLSGYLNLRLLWSHQPTLKTRNEPGAIATNAAGTSVLPSDKASFSADYKLGNFTLDLLERYQSAFHQNANPTLVFDIPDVRAYFQTDLNFGYDFIAADIPFTGFLNIQNVFNTQGGLFQVPGYTGSPGMNYPVGPGADLVGRYFTVGVRFHT